MNAPAWLTGRGGALKQGPDRKTWYVMINDRPQYALVAAPASGRFGCSIRQTINGRRVDSTGVWSTEGEAIAGGLEDIRKSLGWE